MHLGCILPSSRILLCFSLFCRETKLSGRSGVHLDSLGAAAHCLRPARLSLRGRKHGDPVHSTACSSTNNHPTACGPQDVPCGPQVLIWKETAPPVLIHLDPRGIKRSFSRVQRLSLAAWRQEKSSKASSTIIVHGFREKSSQEEHPQG